MKNFQGYVEFILKLPFYKELILEMKLYSLAINVVGDPRLI